MKRTGFSLVELSIVLVILGLLVGGILAGQSLIRAAELRAVSAESNRYIAALNAFRDKYRAYPGDMPNATAFWGYTAGDGTGNDTACRNAAATDARTCNGNGDGKLVNSTGSDEDLRLWQHLVNAGLMEGTYNGIPGSGYIIGTNVPGSKLGSAAWYITTLGAVSGSANGFNGSYDMAMLIFIRYPTTYGIMTPAEAWNLDTKLDDGAPATGRVMPNWSATYSQAGNACTNAVNGADKTAVYDLDSTTKDCGLYFLRVGG